MSSGSTSADSEVPLFPVSARNAFRASLRASVKNAQKLSG